MRAAVALILCSVMVAGCSSEGGSSFQQRRAKADTDGTDPGASGTLDENPGGSTPGATVDPTSACATSTAKAEGAPLYLVFMVDRSGSMNEGGKWTATVSALKSFFADQAMTGISASLQVFPTAAGDQCSLAAYSAPGVPMTALPNPTLFASRLDATTPDGGTPSRPALEGAVAYAKQVQQQHPDGKVAVVLATDGEPSGCQSTVTSVSAAAAREAATIPTYVIGVGAQLTSLNAVAQSGGTKQALIVSTSAPAQIAADFAKAVDGIRKKALACDYKLPPPPSGQVLEVGKVNVRFNGATLSYSSDCASGQGWRYDDAARPTKIEMCPGSCDQVKAATTGSVELLFGCATQGGVIR